MNQATRAGIGIALLIAYIALILTLTGCQSYHYAATFDDGSSCVLAGNARPDEMTVEITPEGTRRATIKNPYVPLTERVKNAFNWARDLLGTALDRIGMEVKS